MGLLSNCDRSTGTGADLREGVGDGPKAWEHTVWKGIVKLAGPTVGGTCVVGCRGSAAAGIRWNGDYPNSDESIVMLSIDYVAEHDDSNENKRNIQRNARWDEDVL